MNPMILRLLERFGPQAARLMNSSAMKFGQIGIPDVPPVTPMTPGTPSGAPSVPISQPSPPQGLSPNENVAQGFSMFNPSASSGIPTMANQNLPTPMDVPPPALSAQAQAPAPMPAPRPPQAPQAPDMNFFQRNAAMMRDPSSGAFIDPMNAERAQASGPDVINKLLQMFHNKANT